MRLLQPHSIRRLTAALLAAGLLLTACGGTTSSGSTPANSSSAAASEPAEDAVDPYAYLADFDFSSIFDENGYVAGVKAADLVTLPEGYDALVLPAGSDKISNAELEEYINSNILEDYATTEQVTDRAAEMGDSVNIDFVGSMDGVEFEGGNSGGAGYDVTLGSNGLIDDFEEQIAGHKPGESFDVVVTFPDPYQNNPDFAGKEAVFATTLNYISESVLPELTDDFVLENLSESTGFTTADELRNDVRETMLFEQQANAIYAMLSEGAELADGAGGDIKDFFTDVVLYSPYMYARAYGIDLESILGTTVDEYLAYAEEYVAGSARQILLMQAVAEQMGIVCDTETLNREFSRFFNGADLQGYLDDYGEGYLKMNILHDLVMEALIAGSSVAKG